LARTIRTTLHRFHRWISLALAAFWLVQAVTGMLIVFHWEIDDLTIAGGPQPIDFIAINARAQALTPPGSGRQIQSIWTAASGSDRFDISIIANEPGAGETVRVNGQGTVLRTHYDGEWLSGGGWIDTLITIHHNLLGGDTGSWIVGISGLLLLSNLVLGLVVGWPARRGWSRALRPSSAGPVPARRYTLHRAVGLWAAFPALLAVSAGVMLVFADGVSALLRPAEWSIAAVPPPANAPLPIAMPKAVATAQELYPSATVSGISYPSDTLGAFRIRLRQKGEDALTYGQTTVFVDAESGRVIGNFDALKAPPEGWIMNGFFAFHTGEIAGLPGRLIMLLIGAWLVTMIVLGVRLWSARQRGR